MPAPEPDRARLHVDVVVRHGDRSATRGLGLWLARTAPTRARGSVTVAVVSDATMRGLNHRHRGVDRATDVLSFSAMSTSGAPAGSRAARPRPLGEIAIARGVAGRQARRAGHAVSTEVRVLALHGLLHLLGYDHERDRGEMARLESRLRRWGGLPGGLIERTPAQTAGPRAAGPRS